MRKVGLILPIIFLGLQFKVYTQDHVDKIAQESCSCIEKVENQLSEEELKIKLGLCMISSAQPYSRQLKKKNGIDMNDLSSGTENSTKLGQLIGLKMAGICPDILIKISGSSAEEGQTYTDNSRTITGKVEDVIENQFITIKVKNNQGSLKFLWLTGFENSDQIKSTLPSLVGKEVELSYAEMDFFDAKTKSYQTFLVISNMILK